MTGAFDERERGYEAKWAHDEETHFQIMARRNTWLAQWAAQTMRLAPEEAGGYVQALIEAGLKGKGQDPVFEKIRGDFAARKVSCSDSAIQQKMKELLDQASETVAKKG
ncbi:MAG TPA: DUF1476 domain-containing protein [Rhizomicrobium sp.]|nr:DUF1476 domain-containing protein [Rhizomicrobium sp.]